MHRASSIDINQFSFRHSCRSLPLNDSTVALSVGVPGREKSIRISRSYTHLSSIFQQIQNHYLFSGAVVAVASALCYSASQPLLRTAGSGPRRSPDIRACRDRLPSAGEAGDRQTTHRRQNPSPIHDWDTTPAAVADVSAQIYCGGGALAAAIIPARGKAGKCACDYRASLPA